jgi:hypothetical protein
VVGRMRTGDREDVGSLDGFAMVIVFGRFFEVWDDADGGGRDARGCG